MNQIKLSIIIPCYRVEQYLNQCLQSIVQPYIPQIEIILVDDGSPDNVPAMCDEWARKDTRIKVIHQKNQGLSGARNSGYDASEGQYVWFFDSDDWLVEKGIEIIVELIDENPEVDVFTTPLIWSYENTSRNRVDIPSSKSGIINGKEFITHYPPGTIQRNIIKREVLERTNIRFYPGILHEDALFGPELYYSASSIYVMDTAIYHYRQRENSIMHSLGIRSAYDMMTVHKELMFFCERLVAEHDKEWFRRKYLTCFKAAIDFVWNIREGNDFKTYLKDTKEYRITECKKCTKGANNFELMQILLLAYFPVFCVWCSKLTRSLINSLK